MMYYVRITSATTHRSGNYHNFPATHQKKNDRMGRNMMLPQQAPVRSNQHACFFGGPVAPRAFFKTNRRAGEMLSILLLTFKSTTDFLLAPSSARAGPLF